MKALYVYDCAAGKLRVARKFPLLVGNTDKCACKMDMDAAVAALFMQNGTECTLHPQSPLNCNGEPVGSAIVLPENREQLFTGCRGMFITYYTEYTGAVPAVIKSYDSEAWYTYDGGSGQWNGPFTKAALASRAGSLPAGSWVSMGGAQNAMCMLDDFMDMAYRLYPGTAVSQPTPAATAPEPWADNSPAAASEEMQGFGDTPNEDEGAYICPTCWLHFNAGDVMSIACHPDLMGDDVLGRASMKRFLATRFNARGQALDDRGTPCPDMACPHCRSKLPPHFLESREHIFSIIGAPSAGKSYYLASLVHEMEHTLPRFFNLSWRDADPTGNSMLNDVTNRLFNSASAEQAYLSKTDLDGALYAEFQRHGRMVKLPKPFVFDVSALTAMEKPVTMIFYDNAGEHFEPGRNSEDSPGARHVSVADGLFFLFDPTTSPKFRRIIGQNADPQLAPGAAARLDQQNIIMAETATRITTILNLGPGDKIDKPMAIMLGKCDLWLDKLPRPLLPIMENGCINQANVDENSRILREFMMELHPSLCTTAEIISTTVRYFAISPLGCSPVTFTDPATGDTKIGPDPAGINPRNVCDPTLWVLSKLNPELVPSI